MEVRDPVHGSIHISDEIVPIIEHFFFKRLRGIKQLGLTEYVFPGATHTRFIHSIGVMCIAEKAFNRIFSDKLDNLDFKRLRETLKLASLLHDIGHAPLSHSTESVMPSLSELGLGNRFTKFEKDLNRQATHEDYTIKSITDSSFTESFSKIEKKYGVKRENVAELVIGNSDDSEYFTIDGINYFPMLHQLVSSEMDCDRMDYLLRDSYFCGVSYGNFDLDWIIDNLHCCPIDGKALLGISERAISTFDDFLLSRFHMFIMVYFHYRPVCLEQLLKKFFETSSEYTIPADIEKYQKHDDHLLMETLRASTNKYAKQIVDNSIPDKIFESFNSNQENVLESVQSYLEQEKLEYIRCSSKGRLSKYYRDDTARPYYKLHAVRSIALTGSRQYIDIDKATDLFSKYSRTHSVNRLHCDKSHLSEKQLQEIQKIIGGH